MCDFSNQLPKEKLRGPGILRILRLSPLSFLLSFQPTVADIPFLPICCIVQWDLNVGAFQAGTHGINSLEMDKRGPWQEK